MGQAARRAPEADRRAPWWRIVVPASLALTLALMLGACANAIDVLPMATGRVDLSAYTLRGPDLAPLRREAARLCPLGGEILRQAGRDQRPADEDGRWRAVANATSALLDPPKRSAELVVVCKEEPGAATVPAMAAASASAVAADAPLAAPIAAPITFEW
jgi:hypothetical protein